MVTRLKYGNTNTYFIRGTKGSILLDTDYAGTLPAFYKEIKKHGITLKDITYLLATHYHPDHIGLVSELMELGVSLLTVDVQLPYVHFSDKIFSREEELQSNHAIQEDKAQVISIPESRKFLWDLGIPGEIISTTSHSADSISLILDNRECFVGDMEPFEYIDGYSDNQALKQDWKTVMNFNPKIIHYGHVPDKIL